ncbi:MAG TPA: GNAT family N-acetyltransferase [Acidimicrobiales bacterium]|nr:GNAT family N-acetyltransferase [Acidimicrobiales bacterium]
MIAIEEAEAATQFLLDSINRLIPQLSSSAGPMSLADLEEMIRAPGTHLLVAISDTARGWHGDELGDTERSDGKHRSGDAASNGGADGATDDRAIVGSLTLVEFRIPTGIRAWIEDVVVDQTVRGGGIGELLVERAVGIATRHGAKTIDLTSRPSRQAAHRLYTKSGFSTRETTVYRRIEKPARRPD